MISQSDTDSASVWCFDIWGMDCWDSSYCGFYNKECKHEKSHFHLLEDIIWLPGFELGVSSFNDPGWWENPKLSISKVAS